MSQSSKLVLLASVAMVLCCSSARAKAQTVTMGVEVRAVRLAPDSRSAVVDLTNTSTKDVSAYAFAYDLTFLDGHHEKGERLVEYLQGIIASQQALGTGWSGQGVFHPGDSREELLALSPDASVTGMTADVNVVIYMDQTADVGNDDAFNVFVSDRKATAQAAKTEATILEAAVDDESDLHPLQTAKAKLQAALTTAGPAGSGVAKGELEGTIHNLEIMQKRPKGNLREELKAYALRKDQQHLITTEHSMIRRRQ